MPMPRRPITVPADFGAAHWRSPSGPGSYMPNGQLESHGQRYRSNPPAWDSEEPLWAARLFVGLNVGAKARWRPADVVRIVKRIRTDQTGDPSSSFLTQTGIYKHGSTGQVVTEKSVQVIILNTAFIPEVEFRQQMVALAEELARRLQQAEVIVELQRGGLVQRTIGVAA